MDSFDSYVAQLYNDFIYENRGRGVWNLEDAWAKIENRLTLAIAQGHVAIDLHHAGWKALQAADRSIVNKGRGLLKRERRTGQLSLDDGHWLNALVALGKNDRCQIGDFGLDEYLRTLANKDDNIAAVQHERDEFVALMAPFVRHLESGMRVRQVVEDGLVNPEEEED